MELTRTPFTVKANSHTFRGYWHQRADERFGDPPPRWIQEPSVVRDRDGRPPRGPPGNVLLLCVCSGSALLGYLLGVSRSRERDLLSVLSIYPRSFFCIFIVYCRILFCYMLMSVDCFGLVVSNCPPPFGRICFVVLVMRKGGESS